MFSSLDPSHAFTYSESTSYNAHLKCRIRALMSAFCAASTQLRSPSSHPRLCFPLLCAWCLKQRSGFCGLIPRSSRCGLVIRCKKFTAVGRRPSTTSLVGIQPHGEKRDARPTRPIWAGDLLEIATSIRPRKGKHQNRDVSSRSFGISGGSADPLPLRLRPKEQALTPQFRGLRSALGR